MTETSEHEALEQVPRDELRLLIESQAEVLELIATNASVEETLEAIVRQCEHTWSDSFAAVVLAQDHGEDSVAMGGDLPARLVPLLDRICHEAEATYDSESDPVSVHLVLTDVEPLGRVASATAVPIARRDGAILGSVVLLFSDQKLLEDSELVLLQRYARLARLSIEQHRSELYLQRLIAEERQWIAGVLHDDPIQAMTAVNLRIQRLARHVGPDLVDTVAEVQQAVTEAIDRMRRLLIDLHPPTLDDEGLVSATDVYLVEVLEPLGITCELHDLVVDQPAIETASLAYRLISEALWNVGKHADATHVTVRIESIAGAVDAVVVDDGVGFDTARYRRRRAGHMGISACRELADRASGSWTIESAPRRGTTVRIHLPGVGGVHPSEPTTNRD